jgi:hypothetical protein
MKQERDTTNRNVQVQDAKIWNVFAIKLEDEPE